MSSLAELRKRAPSLPETELRKRMRLIKRLKERRREIERQLQSPAARRKKHREWQRHVSDTLRWAKNGYDARQENALWDAFLFSEQTKTPQPGWVRDALHRYARDRINSKPLKRRGGRPPSNPLRDLYIFESVNFWRDQYVMSKPKSLRDARIFECVLQRQKDLIRCGHTWRTWGDLPFKKAQEDLADNGFELGLRTIRVAFKRVTRSRRFSYKEAFERVQKELAEENLTARGVRAAYERAKKRLARPISYHGSAFLEKF